MLSFSLFSRSLTTCRVCVVVSYLVLSTSGAALASDKCGSLDRVANATKLAQIIYPDLKGKEFMLQFSSGSGPLSGPFDSRSFLITVDKDQRRPSGEKNGQLAEGAQGSQEEQTELELPLYLRFTFAESIVGRNGEPVGTEPSCQPLKFMNETTSEQMHKAWEVINAHPEWTDAQDWEAAKKLGMRYGPDKKKDLFGIIPLKDLTSVYGPIHVMEAKFITTAAKEPGSNFAILTWLITVKRAGTRGLITVEPFQGKVIAISLSS